jgi:hypothetical protein
VDDMTNLISGSVLYKANARVVSASAEAEQSLFDAFA